MARVSILDNIRTNIKAWVDRSEDLAVAVYAVLTSFESIGKYLAPNTKTVRYVRATGGNDSLNGTSTGAAWATLERGLEWLSSGPMNESRILDIAGTFTVDHQLSIGGNVIGGTNYGFDLEESGPNNFAALSTRQIQAELVAVQDLTITNASAGTTHGLYTITVSETLTSSAHVGQLISGEGLFETAVVQANDANTLLVTTTVDPSTWTGQVALYTPGATIIAGAAEDFFAISTDIIAHCDWSFTGIAFKSSKEFANSAVRVQGLCQVSFNLCYLEGIQMVGGGGQYINIDSCYIHTATGGRVLGVDGAAYVIRTSLLKGLAFRMHASGEFSDILYSVIEACTTPLGGGVTLSGFLFSGENLLITGAVSGADGVRVAFGKSRILNSIIQNCAGDAIEVSDGAQLLLTNVRGSGNGGYGCRILNGGQVQATGTTDVSGTAGQVYLGGTGATTWAGAPKTDVGATNPEFVRLY